MGNNATSRYLFGWQLFEKLIRTLFRQSHLFSQPGDVFPGSVVTAGGVVPGVVPGSVVPDGGVVPGSVVPAGGVVPTTQLVCCTCGRKVLSLKVKIQFNLGRISNLLTHPIYLERENTENCLQLSGHLTKYNGQICNKSGSASVWKK